MLELFKIMGNSIRIFFEAMFYVIKIGVVYMIVFFIQAQEFINKKYDIIYWIILAVGIIGLLFLEGKTKKILNGEYTAEECKKLQIRGNKFRDIVMTLAILVSFIAERYAGGLILLVVEIMMLRLGNSRLERELDKKTEMMEVQRKMFVAEAKDIRKDTLKIVEDLRYLVDKLEAEKREREQ